MLRHRSFLYVCTVLDFSQKNKGKGEPGFLFAPTSSFLHLITSKNKGKMSYKKSDYSQKLLDPRWQKKRLEILNRDEFTCTSCGDDSSTLHVHHFIYSTEPWEVDNNYLTTLCDSCHQSEHDSRLESEKDLLNAIKKCGFLSHSVHTIAKGFDEMKPFHATEVMASVIQWAVSNQEIMQKLTDLFFEDLRHSIERKEGE